MPEYIDGLLASKLDSQPTDGLEGVEDSLAYRVHEIEKHLHNNERWIGAAAVPDGETHIADTDSMTAFQIDAGNDTWGPWLQIIGSEDTPITAGMAKFDLHRVLVSDVERRGTITRIQIASGESGAAALASGDYSEIMMLPDNQGKLDPYDLLKPRYVSGTKTWSRCWVSGQDTGTISFFCGIHEYIG
jgi:hypothetical protein